jgi:ketosteroid isomerase-like protein
MSDDQTALLQSAYAFLQAIESGASGDELDAFYDPEVEQTEYPNAITKQVTKRTLAHLKAGSLMGKKILSSQKFEVVRGHVAGNTVILEVIWTAVAAMQLGAVPAGGTMKAYFAQFFEYRDGKMLRQRNYDCFEPFSPERGAT